MMVDVPLGYLPGQWDLQVEGDYKGYDYRPNERYKDAQVVASLDNIKPESTKIEFYKRQLSGDWYLVFEHWP